MGNVRYKANFLLISYIPYIPYS